MAEVLLFFVLIVVFAFALWFGLVQNTKKKKDTELLNEYVMFYTVRVRSEKDLMSYALPNFISREARIKAETSEDAKKKLEKRLRDEFALSFEIE